MTTRRRFTAEFKAKVAQEAIRGELTVSELARKHGVHPNLIAGWKRQAIEGMAGRRDRLIGSSQHMLPRLAVERITGRRLIGGRPRARSCDSMCAISIFGD
jgi:transposase-like protein